jgi:hypothetical protein
LDQECDGERYSLILYHRNSQQFCPSCHIIVFLFAGRSCSLPLLRYKPPGTDRTVSTAHLSAFCKLSLSLSLSVDSSVCKRQLRPSVFGDVAPPKLAVYCRRFRTYHCHGQGASSPRSNSSLKCSSSFCCVSDLHCHVGCRDVHW